MYKVPELLKSIRLSEIEIPNQEKIIAATGSKLDLEEAYKVIETVSENFSQWDEKAIEADALLSELIVKHLQKTKITETPPSEIVQEKRTASASRKRKLRLMKLKLGLKKQQLTTTQI